MSQNISESAANQDHGRVVTVDKAAELLGVNPITIRRMLASGRLTHINLGTARRACFRIPLMANGLPEVAPPTSGRTQRRRKSTFICE